MRIYARKSLVSDSLSAREPALLLEGSWPVPAPDGRWSLDESIDGAWSWLDGEACRLAADVGEGDSPAIGPSWLNELQLRYYMLKLLRVSAFVDSRRDLVRSGVDLYLEQVADADYAELFESLSLCYGFDLRVTLVEARSSEDRPRAASTSRLGWRGWAGRLAQRPATPAHSGRGESVLLCGSPRTLDPVCAVLLERGVRVTWFYDQFALRSWWRWRRAGARQWVCARRPRSARRFTDVILPQRVVWRGVDLTKPVERWLVHRAAEAGPRQLEWLECFERAFRQLRPSALLLDEDATPLKRVAVAVARQHGVRSLVVQHGAPCVSFGFAPLAADAICAWGDVTRRQLVRWGAPADRVITTGWPAFEAKSADGFKPRRRAAGHRARILLLASTPARDNRPDAACLHATVQTYADMMDFALAAVAELPAARLTVKLHPRDSLGRDVRERLVRQETLDARLERHAPLRQLLAECDCVLSCASTAGIEAALLGAPVIQILPRGSADVLPASEWGMIGSARDLNELRSLLATALARGWIDPATSAGEILANGRDNAADRVVDAALQGLARPLAVAADAADAVN